MELIEIAVLNAACSDKVSFVQKVCNLTTNKQLQKATQLA